MAPRGWDAATLWGNSLAVPALAERVQREYQAALDSRCELVSQHVFLRRDDRCWCGLRGAAGCARAMGWASAWTIGLLSVAAVLLAVFLRIDSCAHSALMPRALFRFRGVAAANIVGVL